MERDRALELILDKVEMWRGYTRVPPRLERLYPALAQLQLDDTNGMVARLRAIESILSDKHLGTMIDLGGNSGYYSLSLIDDKMATSSTIYDNATDALSAGEHMAELLGIAGSVSFVRQEIDLEFARSLPQVDTILCLNFLHNAGIHFDVERVSQQGWAAYVQQWLRLLREKSRQAVVSLAFNHEHPVHWSESLEHKARRFAGFAEDAGWSIRYYANVRELERLGVDTASGRQIKASRARADAAVAALIRTANTLPLRPFKEALKRLLRQTQTLPKIQRVTGTQKFYHLYILG